MRDNGGNDNDDDDADDGDNNGSDGDGIGDDDDDDDDMRSSTLMNELCVASAPLLGVTKRPPIYSTTIPCIIPFIIYHYVTNGASAVLRR